MIFSYLSVKNWFKRILKSERRTNLWHFFPIGNELNIKSALEILFYIFLIVVGFWLYLRFNRVETKNVSLCAENLTDQTFYDKENRVFDTIISHSAKIKILIPKYDFHEEYFEKNNAKEIYRVSFSREHKIFQRRLQLISDSISRFNYINGNYRSMRIFVDNIESFQFNGSDDNICYLLNDSINGFGRDSTERERNVRLFKKILVGSNYNEYFKDSPEWLIVEDKTKSLFARGDTIPKLRDLFYSICEDSVPYLDKDSCLYPLDYFRIEFDNGYLTPDKKLTEDINQIFYSESNNKDVKNSGGINQMWISGINSEVLNCTHEVSTMLFSKFKIKDLSKTQYHINLESSTLDSIELEIEFIGPCSFGEMYPKPDEITSSSIKFNDQWKILTIKKHGLDFIVTFNKYENIQNIILFIIQAVISGLIIILITFIIIATYKVLIRKKKQLPINKNKKLSLLETDGISTDIIDNL